MQLRPRASAAEALVVLAAAVVYVATSARTILGGDNGELCAVASAGGVAHPPGYPLYVLWLRALAWLPATSPAHAAAIATAILGVFAIRAMQVAARAWGASPLSSAFVSAIYAFSPLAWELSTSAETFTLNVLVAMLIVAASAPEIVARAPERTAIALPLLAGLGLSNHHSIVLLAPIGLFSWICAIARSTRRSRAIALGAIAFAIGLAPYATLVISARHATASTAPTWGDTRTLAGLWDHFLRKEYGTTELGIGGHREPALQIVVLARSLAVGLLGLPIVAALVGLFALAKRRSLRGQLPLMALLATWVVAGPLFVARFNTPPSGLGFLIIERFHLLPAAIACVLTALAIDRVVGARPIPRVVAIALPSLAGVASASLAAEDVREHHDPGVERYAHDALAIAPPNAILVGSGDHRFGAFQYARHALRERTDVVFVNAHLLLTRWYPDEASALLGFPIVRSHAGPTGRPTVDVPALIAQLVATGRPVFLTDSFTGGNETALPTYPIGPLMRVVASPEEVPALDALFALNVAADAQMAPADRPREAWVGWDGILAQDYARPWLALERTLRGAGDVARADASLRRAKLRIRLFSPPND